MRRWLLGITWVALTACGGGGGSSGSTGVSGTIGGQAFKPAEVSAVIAGPSTCTVPTDFTAKAFAIRLGDFTGVCTDLESDPLCKLKASARSVTVVFADVGAVNPTPTLGTGTFAVSPDPTNAVLQTTGPLAGTLVASFAVSTVTGASCPTDAVAQVAQGTLRVDSVTATSITGNVDLTFGDWNGTTFTAGTDKLKGDFTATVCAASISDVCPLAASGGACMGMPSCD